MTFPSPVSAANHLTRSEAIALALFAGGARCDDVALALGTSSTSVRDMQACILDKLGVRSRAEAISIWRGEQYEAAMQREAERRRHLVNSSS